MQKDQSYEHHITLVKSSFQVSPPFRFKESLYRLTKHTDILLKRLASITVQISDIQSTDVLRYQRPPFIRSPLTAQVPAESLPDLQL